MICFGKLKGSKTRSKSRSPARSLTPPSPTVSGPSVPGKSRSISPLRNIEVPVSNLQPVKEESEISSSEHEHDNSAASPPPQPLTTAPLNPIASIVETALSIDENPIPNPVLITLNRDQVTPTREEVEPQPV